MATAPVIRKKNQVYQSNINRRGHVKPTLKEKKSLDLPVTYLAFGVLLFAVLGGAVLQVIDLIF